MDGVNSSKTSADMEISSYIADPNSKTYDRSSNTVLDEASKILEIETKKDFSIREKNKVIQTSIETIENLRKNIFRIQTDYEILKQNYQKEVSNAAEALKRINVTRNMLETTEECSKILAASIQKLEDDKFKLIKFYEGLREKQEEEEEKRQKIEITIQEQKNLIENVSQMLAEKMEIQQKLNNDLSQSRDKLKYEMNKSSLLEKDIGKCSDEIKELRSVLALEQTVRIKYQINERHLKKKMLIEKAENKKNLKQQKVLHNMKLKFLKNKLKNFKGRLLTHEANFPSNSRMQRDNSNSKVDPDGNAHTIYPNHADDMDQHRIKKTDNFTETVDLDDLTGRRDEKIELKHQKISTLKQENMNLINAQKAIMILLQEKENEIRILQEENSNHEKKIEELLLEMNRRSVKGSTLSAAVQTYNTEIEYLEKIKMYKEKLANYEIVETELRNEILLLREGITQKRWENETEMIESRTEILRLENEISKLQAQKEATEKELKEINTQFIQVKNELTMKSADLDKITTEFEIKMKIMTNEVELLKESRINLDKERQLNRELIELVKKLEKESEMLTICQETNSSLKKSLETYEANEEAYKLVIQKLEEELAGKKNQGLVEYQSIKKPQQEIFQLKQSYEKNENNENKEGLLETSKSHYNRRSKF